MLVVRELPHQLYIKFSSLIFIGTLLAVASNDGTIKMHMIDNEKVTITSRLQALYM